MVDNLLRLACRLKYLICESLAFRIRLASFRVATGRVIRRPDLLNHDQPSGPRLIRSRFLGVGVLAGWCHSNLPLCC